MTLRGNGEKYRFCSDDIENGIKKRSQVCARGRHTKNVAEKIATMYAFVDCKAADVEFPENCPVQIVVACNFGTICGKFRIYTTILFVALTSEIFSITALFATNRPARPTSKALPRVTMQKPFFIREFRGRIGAYCRKKMSRSRRDDNIRDAPSTSSDLFVTLWRR